MPARAAIWPKVTGCPAAASSAQAASTRASSPRSAGMGLGDEQVEPVDEAAVAGGFGAPAAGGGVGGEGFGVGALQLQYRQEAGLGAEVRAVLADVGVGARALGGGAQAVAAGQPGLNQRRFAPVPAGDGGQRQLGALAGQYRAELGLGQGEGAGVFVADGGVEQPAVAQAHLCRDVAEQ